MRKIILILLTLLFCYFANAQEYTPFDFEKGIWISGYFYETPDLTYRRYGQLFCKGDTVINSFKYYKLYTYSIYLPSVGRADTMPLQFSKYVRNNDKKQLVYLYDNSNEEVLYDFNLKIGDTILNATYGKIDGRLNIPIVKNIDSVMICGIYHKRYRTQYYNGTYNDTSSLIEGIGMNMTLFGAPDLIDAGEQTYLCCYTERGDNICSKCDLLLSIKKGEPISEDVKIFPNPVSSELSIRSSIPINDVSIFSLIGQTLFKNTGLNSQIITINTENLNKGIYLIKLRLSNSEYKTKILIKI